MRESENREPFKGRLVMVGFGCMGQATLPLLLRHIAIDAQRVLVVTPDGPGLALAQNLGTQVLGACLTPANYRPLLTPHLARGDFLVNLSVDVSSTALIALCQELGALYLDTRTEPWAGGYLDPRLSNAQRSNYALRASALAVRSAQRDAPTAVLTHGASPGLASHLVKQGLLNLAQDSGMTTPPMRQREDWARLAQRLNLRCIHIAERDSQQSAQRKLPGEFVNTGSVSALVNAGCQPAELGWGSHERRLPHDGMRHESGSLASIYLHQPGAATRVRSWTPLAGAMHAFLISQAEAVSIAEHLTLGDNANPHYRPTVHRAYHPCDDALLSLDELAGRNYRVQERQRVLQDEIASGGNELGVLLMGHARGAYWYGSQLTLAEARSLCPHNSASTLPVAAAVTAGVVWALRNPRRGVVEPDEMPFDELLSLCRPYLGTLTGVYTDWTPLDDRGWLFDEDTDESDPWQFKNFRVN